MIRVTLPLTRKKIMEDTVKNSTETTPVKPVHSPRKKPETKTAAPVTPTETTKLDVPTFIDPREAKKRAAKEKWMKEREYKAKMVTGKFLFNECPGGELIFHYREFPGDANVKYVMRHDSIHTIPLGVAMHLNDRCAYPEYAHNLDGGKAISGVTVELSAQNMFIQSKVHRTNFIPLDFTLDAGNWSGKSIVQVTYENPLSNTHMLDSMGR